MYILFRPPSGSRCWQIFRLDPLYESDNNAVTPSVPKPEVSKEGPLEQDDTQIDSELHSKRQKEGYFTIYMVLKCVCFNLVALGEHSFSLITRITVRHGLIQ